DFAAMVPIDEPPIPLNARANQLWLSDAPIGPSLLICVEDHPPQYDGFII
ncbi:unnamed protein product, partial [marine sediment metagenome]